jgi:hypothetical protein
VPLRTRSARSLAPTGPSATKRSRTQNK